MANVSKSYLTLIVALCVVQMLASVYLYAYLNGFLRSVVVVVPSREERPGQVQTVESSRPSTQAKLRITQPSLGTCPEKPPKLVGPLAVSIKNVSWEEVVAVCPGLEKGGTYSPKDCKPKESVAIIIPYRNRESQLKQFLFYMHRILQRQQVTYGIFVIEQAPNSTFNRGLLMNIGYAESRKLENYTCFIFHDVDLIPEDDRNLYRCPPKNSPRHMSVAVDKFLYKLPYKAIFGGICAFNDDQFKRINGFSNVFFGWGGEDDDLYYRLRNKGYSISRYPIDIARYKMIKHDSDHPVNKERWRLLQSAGRDQDKNGVSTLVYEVKDIQTLDLYTKITVIIDEAKVIAASK